jgi:hypothetical protein
MQYVIDHTGQERALGNQIATPGLLQAWPVYGDAAETPMVARRLWPALIAEAGAGPDHPALPPVHDQQQIGQCNAEAVTAAAEFTRAVQGLPYVRLSAGDLYGRINGGVDRGSLLEQGMAEAMRRGVGTAQTCGTLWRPDMRQAGDDERAGYRVLEAWQCPTFDHLLSAALSGFAIISGVLWYENYGLDGDGWLYRRGSGRVGGHALMSYRPAMRHGQYGLWTLQSWGEGWGLRGRFVLPEVAYGQEIGGWAVREVTMEAGYLPAIGGAGLPARMAAPRGPVLPRTVRWDREQTRHLRARLAAAAGVA